MRQDLRLRSPKLFKQVYAQGKSVHAEDLVLHYLKGDRDEQAGVGFSVSKRVGNAVTRNKLKRRLRAIMEEFAVALKPGVLLVFVARPGAATASFGGLNESVRDLLRRARGLEVGSQ